MYQSSWRSASLSPPRKPIGYSRPKRRAGKSCPSSKVSTANPYNDVAYDLPDRRYDSDFRTLKKLIDNGALGKVTECEIHFDQDRDPGPATDLAPGGGMLFGIGSHTLDQVNQSAGAAPPRN